MIRQICQTFFQPNFPTIWYHQKNIISEANLIVIYKHYHLIYMGATLSSYSWYIKHTQYWAYFNIPFFKTLISTAKATIYFTIPFTINVVYSSMEIIPHQGSLEHMQH